MYDPQLDQKMQYDGTQVKNDMDTLIEDGISKVNKVTEDSNQSTEDVAAWVNSGVDQLSNKYEKVKGDATKTVAHASNTVMKNVGNSLSQYNAKAAEVANKLPGGVGAKASKYPWVAISVALIAGFLLRSFLMPGRD